MPIFDQTAAALMLLFPHGGQRGARRNARAALTAAQSQSAAHAQAVASLRTLGQSSSRYSPPSPVSRH